MPTYRQQQDFTAAVLKTDGLLDDAIDWIKNHLSPDDVFSDSDLCKWAQDQSVEDVTRFASLAEWAADNGYVKEGMQ